MTACIEVQGLHKAYRRGTTLSPVLNGIDLKIGPGRCVFLVGPSGSGKTTLLSILGCILSPDAGRVRVLGRDLARLVPAERALLRRDHIGFVFQRFHLIRGLSAWENVGLPLTLRGQSPRALRPRALALLAAVGLADQADKQPAGMSTGQCQRVALARALAGDPELVLADEPTAALDAHNGQEVMRLLRRLTVDQGKSAIVVTHDPRIFDYADEVYRLDEGRIASLPGGVHA